jgi:uncharacterized damage-inducible protein DinB
MPERDVQLSATNRDVLLRACAALFGTEPEADRVLNRLTFPWPARPQFSRDPLPFWRAVFVELDRGIVALPYRRLLLEALRTDRADESVIDIADRCGLRAPQRPATAARHEHDKPGEDDGPRRLLASLWEREARLDRDRAELEALRSRFDAEIERARAELARERQASPRAPEPRVAARSGRLGRFRTRVTRPRDPSADAVGSPLVTRIDEHGRPHPLSGGDEAGTLLGFLDYQRATFAWKCAGLDAAGLARTVGVSSMTLGGMLKHMSYVEDHWFGKWLHGREPAPPWDTVDWQADPDWDWHSAAHDTPEQLRALWQDTVTRSRSLVAEALAGGDLGRPSLRVAPDGEAPSLRWILCHMIEEYARHNGHADLIRESVDGQTGE